MSAPDDPSHLSHRIAHHVATVSLESIPLDALDAARRSLLDALGVMLAASTMGEGCRAFAEIAIADGGQPTSTIVGFAARVPPGAAALANGAFAHALDYEDAHDTALVHPNAQTIPAVLALAEAQRASGAEVLAAIAVGSDLVCRLGLALREDPARFGWYPPPILQAFGAAAGAARILRLGPEATLDALSLTLAQVTGTAEMTRGARSVVRGVRDGFGASAGVLAARLAQAGVAGFDAPFEGESGLYALYAAGSYDRAKLISDLGERYEGANVAFKPWPSCRGTHAAIRAALAHRAAGVVAQQIDDVLVVGSSLNHMLCEPAEQRRSPATAIDAKFSIPYTVAQALVHGEVGLDAFESAALADPAVLEMANKVRYEIDPDDSPGAATRARLMITTTDGARHEVAAVAPGGIDDPLTDESLVSKFRANARLAAVPLSEATIAAVVSAVSFIERSPDIAADLMALLGPEPRAQNRERSQSV